MHWPQPVTTPVLNESSRTLILINCAEPSGGEAAVQSSGWEEECAL